MNIDELLEKGWFVMPRNFCKWRWYGDANCVRMYLHLMMKASYITREWKDTVVERGELITSLENLATELNISVKQVRNVLNKLQKTNCIQRKGTNRYTRLKIVNYSVLQDPESYGGQTKGKQGAYGGQTEGKQGATSKKEKKEKKYKKDIYNGFAPKTNFFTDYDDEVSELELQLLRQRMNR